MKPSEGLLTSPSASFQPLYVYDAACNLFRSVVLRMLWALAGKLLYVDCFYRQRHVCCPRYDANTNADVTQARMSGAEWVNAILEIIRITLMYSRASNYIHIVLLPAMYLILSGCWRFVTSRHDADTADVAPLANKLMPCGCIRCEKSRLECTDSVRMERAFIVEAVVHKPASTLEGTVALSAYYRERRHLFSFLNEKRRSARQGTFGTR